MEPAGRIFPVAANLIGRTLHRGDICTYVGREICQPWELKKAPFPIVVNVIAHAASAVFFFTQRVMLSEETVSHNQHAVRGGENERVDSAGSSLFYPPGRAGHSLILGLMNSVGVGRRTLRMD